jgi:hypothetical protein
MARVCTRRTRLWLSAAFMVIGACTTTTKSVRVDGCLTPLANQPSAASTARLDCRRGVAYSLPKAQVTLNASRHRVATTDPRADLAVADLAFATEKDPEKKAIIGAVQQLLGAIVSASDLVNAANNLVTKDQAAVSAAQTALSDDTAAKAAATKIATDKKTLSEAQDKLAKEKLSLDTANASLAKAQAAFPKWQETATLTVIPAVPDPTARYVANLAHEPTRDDTLKISVVNGLLSSSNTVSTDQTPNLIVSLADAAITAGSFPGVKGVAAPAPVATIDDVRTALDCSYDIVEVFDPTSDEQKAVVDADLSAVNSHITLEVASSLPGDSGAAPPDQTDGLVYRIATPVVIRASAQLQSDSIFARCPLAALPTAQSALAVVPDSRTSYVINNKAGAFTTTNQSFGFSNGMLTDYSIQRPSEIAAVANIPVRIAQDLIQIPTQLLQLRLNYDTQATAVVNAQTAYQQALLSRTSALATSQATIVNAQTALRQAQLNQPIAVVNEQTALVNAQTTLQQSRANQPLAGVNSQIALVNANTALQQAQAGGPIAMLNSQTALQNAETALQQAKIGESTAVTTARTALINASTAYQQALIQQPTALTNAETTLVQAHAALIQAEQALEEVMAKQKSK